jgi:RimJ/RimL family protein N-acetyltransferase
MLTRLAADPLVVRYVGDGQCWSAEKAAKVSRRVLAHWHAHGFGWRAAVDKRSGESVGIAAFNYAGEGFEGLDAKDLEIGWWLRPAVWGRGLATEAARALSEEAFRRLGAVSVVARLQPGNRASARVAERLGMSPEYETTGLFGEPVAVYRLTRGHWLATDGASRAMVPATCKPPA